MIKRISYKILNSITGYPSRLFQPQLTFQLSDDGVPQRRVRCVVQGASPKGEKGSPEELVKVEVQVVWVDIVVLVAHGSQLEKQVEVKGKEKYDKEVGREAGYGCLIQVCQDVVAKLVCN